MEPVFCRTEFNYDISAASDASGLKCEDESLTKQSFAAEADINEIVRRFGLNGQLPSNVSVPVHADFRGAPDFHGAWNLIVQAREGFAQLPAEVRKRFNNDAGALVDFLSDESNRDEAVKLGLVVKASGQGAAEPAPATPGASPAAKAA